LLELLDLDQPAADPAQYEPALIADAPA